mgnify:CR=1 FL=1
MKYDVKVLEKMVDFYSQNIEMFTGYSNVESQVSDMVANRRLIASFIENGGESTVPSNFRNGNVFFDVMVYTACAGADTSKWG